MTAVRDRALWRLREFEDAHPEAAALACYASLATRIDPTLLRRLRLNLVQRASAGAEADLWFSDLSESRDGQSLVLDPGVAAVLRERLASQFLPDGRPALDVAFEHTRSVHDRWPASLRLEEELVYVALRDQKNAAAAIARLLRPAIAAMAANEQRAVEMSRWVLRAMPRMPGIVRNTDAAAAMILAAIAHIGSDGDALGGLETRPLPADLAWMLPPAALARRTALVCDVRANAVIFRAPIADRSEPVIEVPKTQPIVLELRWTDRAASGTRIVAVELEAAVPLPESWHRLELQSLSGETYRIERTLPRPIRDGKFETDVFVSYAHLDDVELVEGKAGWVANLHRALEIRLAQLLGKPVRVWRDPKLEGNDVLADTVTEHLQRTAVLVSVVSARSVKSEWWQRELNEFLKGTGGGRVGDKSRVFIVMKEPVPRERTPLPIQSLLGYEFFKVDPDSGRVRELNEVFGPEAQRDFWLKLDDLAHDIGELLRILDDPPPVDRPGPEAGPSPADRPGPAAGDVTSRRRVYVVCDQRDLEATRAVGDLLFLHGFDVLMPNFDGDETEARARHEESLRTCDAVLLYYGAAGEVWVRRQFRDIQKAAGFGRVAAPPATAVYLAPPDTPAKRLFRTHQAQVLAGLDNAPETALAPFVAALA